MIPYSRPKLSDLYTLSKSKLLETIPFTAAHTYIAHIWQYPPPPPEGLWRLQNLRVIQAELPSLLLDQEHNRGLYYPSW